jgi:hypothetical protein
MDLEANYSRSDVVHQRRFAEMALRVVSFEGMPDGQKFQIENFRSWDGFDYDSFCDEVTTQELLRASKLSGERPGSPVQRLERAIEQAQGAANSLGTALREVLLSAKATENMLGPLKAASS